MKPDKVVIVAAMKEACLSDYVNLGPIDCLVVKPDTSLSVGERVGIALTVALRRYAVGNYDYFLKLDDDVMFGPKFVETNVRSHYDLMGRGAAMVINARKYVQLFNHKWPVCPADDTYVIYRSVASGLRVLEWRWVEKAFLLKEPAYSARRRFLLGVELYKFGVPLAYVVLSSLKSVVKSGVLSHLITVYGYVVALIVRRTKYEFSDCVRDYHKKKLTYKVLEFIRK
ncbi:MAG: hypothetical protein QXM79_04400 [Zestosphaera sp.]